MKISNLKNKKIAILGLGIENFALINYLIGEEVECDITIYDRRNNQAIGKKYFKLKNKAMWVLKDNYKHGILGHDIMFRSPGWPIHCPYIIEAREAGIELKSPMQLFFELSLTKNIIGVTGTKGKGTTASLIYHILEKAGKKTWLGGNIGIAPFDFIKKVKKNDWVVLELSSFQLEDMTLSPRIAVITNFTKEHLAAADPNNPNYHRNLTEYWEAKMNIVKWQRTGGMAVINQKLKAKYEKHLSAQAGKSKSKKIYFTKSGLPSKLIGEHNKENVAAAKEVTRAVGIKDYIIRQAVASFKGLEHRIEYVKTIKGVKYYNDTFATIPESTITALKSFDSPIVLLAGGAEKNSDFKKLVEEITKRVKFMVLFKGTATHRLKQELYNNKYPSTSTKVVASMGEAVKLANEQAVTGDVVLLSTACASFGMFKNYKERGLLFKDEVQRLK